MIGALIAQLAGTAIVSRKRAIGMAITRLVFVLLGLLLIVAAAAFGLVAAYHALTPLYGPAQAAAIIAGLLALIGILAVLVALKARRRPAVPPPGMSAVGRTNVQSAELSAIHALGELNQALTDISKGKGGITPQLGLMGVAALVGFIAGRKR